MKNRFPSANHVSQRRKQPFHVPHPKIWQITPTETHYHLFHLADLRFKARLPPLRYQTWPIFQFLFPFIINQLSNQFRNTYPQEENEETDVNHYFSISNAS